MPDQTLNRGARLGRYEIRQMLGQGGMGQVYRAWDLVLKRDVAVKVLGTPNEELLQRFAREAEAISQLDNPNVVTIHDFQADRTQPYIVMEYLQGEDLSARLRQGPMTVGDAVDTILGVCSAVHACHALGIIHRDLKPGNVFLHRTVEFGVVVKVLDFGVAMLRQDTFSEITEPGYVVGTPRYLSPEQVEHKDADAKSDQYATGHLLYTMLAGKSPFAKKQGSQLIKAILNSEYPRLAEIRPDVPASLVAAVERSMSVAPAQRYGSVLALARDMMRYVTDGERIPQELLPAASESDPPADSDQDYSRTTVDVQVASVESGRSTSGVDRAAAVGATTLEGDDSQSAGGPKVVPIAPYQAMPTVSTTARLPTETAIDLSFPGGQHEAVLEQKNTAPHLRYAGRQPVRAARKRGVCASGTVVARLLGLGGNRLLVVAALVLAVVVALLAMALGRSGSSSETSPLRTGLAQVAGSAIRTSILRHQCLHLGRRDRLVQDVHLAKANGSA